MRRNDLQQAFRPVASSYARRHASKARRAVTEAHSGPATRDFAVTSSLDGRKQIAVDRDLSWRVENRDHPISGAFSDVDELQ